MDRRTEAMNLILFFAPTGRMATAWRRPTSPVQELWGPELPVRIAQQAEAARFDAVFLADVLYHLGGPVGSQPFHTGYEPFTTMSVMAARTRHIGLIGTASTAFLHPYAMARYLTGLDWISGGRVGWNIVTSEAGEQHYGIDLPPREERYLRTEDYLAATKALWDAWDDDAVVNDRAGARWARAERIHEVDHRGAFHRTAGQLFLHRSPQGHPVLVQAGQSPAGRRFAARHAEVIFTAQTDLGTARDFYAEVKAYAVEAGRDPDAVRIIPGLTPVVGATDAEARDREAELDRWVDVAAGLPDLEVAIQADLSGLDVDRPIPPELLTHPDDLAGESLGASRYRNFYLMAVRDRLTIRRIIALNERALGHRYLIGAVADVADQMDEWFQGRACDGFAIAPATVPEGVDDTCELLMPELRRRGLARREYPGTTLRENLGLARPAPVRPATAAGGR